MKTGGKPICILVKLVPRRTLYTIEDAVIRTVSRRMLGT